MGGIESFLRAIPIAAKSPYAFFAYAISALLFIASVRQRIYIKPSLRKIASIPKEDRKSVIETTLNTKLPDKLSGEQFLRRERMKYVFLAFIAVLVLVGSVTTIALVRASNDKSQTKNAKIRVQLWPRPEIRTQFLRDHDAHLYLKGGNTQLDLTSFVPTDDFLDETVDVEDDLIGKPVDLMITPRDKYAIQQDRRYLTQLVRLEVYPLGKNPIPAVTTLLTPSGEELFRTTDLPLSSSVTRISHKLSNPSESSEIVASRPYLLDFQGRELSAMTKVDIVDAKGDPVTGAWAGNELGASNGTPVEVNGDGTSLKVYFAAPSSATGERLFWRIENPHSQIAMEGPITVVGHAVEKQ